MGPFQASARGNHKPCRAWMALFIGLLMTILSSVICLPRVDAEVTRLHVPNLEAAINHPAQPAGGSAAARALLQVSQPGPRRLEQGSKQSSTPGKGPFQGIGSIDQGSDGWVLQLGSGARLLHQATASSSCPLTWADKDFTKASIFCTYGFRPPGGPSQAGATTACCGKLKLAILRARALYLRSSGKLFIDLGLAQTCFTAVQVQLARVNVTNAGALLSNCGLYPQALTSASLDSSTISTCSNTQLLAAFVNQSSAIRTTCFSDYSAPIAGSCGGRCSSAVFGATLSQATRDNATFGPVDQCQAEVEAVMAAGAGSLSATNNMATCLWDPSASLSCSNYNWSLLNYDPIVQACYTGCLYGACASFTSPAAQACCTQVTLAKNGEVAAVAQASNSPLPDGDQLDPCTDGYMDQLAARQLDPTLPLRCLSPPPGGPGGLPPGQLPGIIPVVATTAAATSGSSGGSAAASSSGVSGGAVVGIVVGTIAAVVVLGVVLAGALLWVQRKRRGAEGQWAPMFKKRPVAGGPGTFDLPLSTLSRKSSNGPSTLSGALMHQLSLRELFVATKGFSENLLVGRGGNGSVYKGILGGGEVVAVKRVEGRVGSRQFENEVQLLARLNHRHLVHLIGWCEEQGEKLLVYPYMANGSLQDCLERDRPLVWGIRLRIAYETALALEYLHMASPPVIHRDVKSGNVLLDRGFHVKVSDFGISRLTDDFTSTNIQTGVKGTVGWLDPQYFLLNKLTEKSDVYSFGVLLLAILSGRRPLDPTRPPEEQSLVRQAIPRLSKGNIEFLLDPSLPHTDKVIASARSVASLALWCLEDELTARPSMSEAARSLELTLAEAPWAVAETDEFVRQNGGGGGGRRGTHSTTGSSSSLSGIPALGNESRTAVKVGEAWANPTGHGDDTSFGATFDP